jgi:hypothetical protein
MKEHAMREDANNSTGRFDIGAIAAALPETATTLLVDRYLTNRSLRWPRDPTGLDDKALVNFPS